MHPSIIAENVESFFFNHRDTTEGRLRIAVSSRCYVASAKRPAAVTSSASSGAAVFNTRHPPDEVFKPGDWIMARRRTPDYSGVNPSRCHFAGWELFV